MTRLECRAELVLAERRGELPRVARQALDNHLRVCDSCRILREYGGAFEGEQQVDVGDAAKLDAMLAASDRWLRRARTQRWRVPSTRRYRLALLAAALSVCSMAAAAAAIVTRVGSPSQVELPAKPWTANPASPARAAIASALVAPFAAAARRLPPDLTESVAKRRAPVNESEPGVTAAQLLQQATLSRRNGSTGEATKLFRRLQQQYPSTREAKLSLVAFGSLLLETGQPAEALEQFNRYLVSSAGQSLNAEALYGKGRALAQLGRTQDERSAWLQLVERFPNSPYVSHARKRLAQSP